MKVEKSSGPDFPLLGDICFVRAFQILDAMCA